MSIKGKNGRSLNPCRNLRQLYNVQVCNGYLIKVTGLLTFLNFLGEAEYVNDIQPQKGELFGAFVISTVASANLASIDASEALVSVSCLIYF